MNIRGKVAASQALLIVAPTFAVVAIRFWGIGAESALAGQSNTEQVASLQPHDSIWAEFGSLKPGESSAADRTLGGQGSGRTLQSPFVAAATTETSDMPRTVVVEPGESTAAVRPPRVTLTSILPNAQRPIAVIDGKPVTAGKTVAPGWVLDEIAPDGRSVFLRHESGARVKVSLSR